ncbi:hypothetical protein CSIM01_04894 [Colletotrichum simmondsii]|uniref:Secreted protein n=1 Tax=Colletotrichum simmondsii TaxID=703756 RepID=A0A135TKA3_9PEZI|nr:hypothetical protein CSIM01_04894 [Colletotrichum simmondsii]
MGFIVSTLAWLGGLTAIVVAAPVDKALTPAIFARAEATVFMCDDTRFRGRCRTDVIQTGSCFIVSILLIEEAYIDNVPETFIDSISSIRNDDRNRNTCTWYRLFN